MLSPKQLFINFSNNYCDDSIKWGRRNLLWGKGAAYDFEGFVQLLKSLPHSCMSDYRNNVYNSNNDELKQKFSKFTNSGYGKLALPYKFLQILDPDAFREIQQDEYASVSHAVRNACDISRACKLFWDSRSAPDNGLFYTWEGRGATEPIYYYAYNSLVKALMFIGPNRLLLSDAQQRFNGCSESQMSCVPTLLGAAFQCICGPFASCPPQKKTCKISSECEEKGCVEAAKCANEPLPDSDLYGLHTGYYVRKSYAGYGNFISNGNFFGAQDNSIFSLYSRQNNAFNYNQADYDLLTKFHVHRTVQEEHPAPKIQRAKHVTLATTPEEIKDFLYNGYGIVLSTNVGFSDKRDSIGISYPDRLWYHTMSIIGYDDTRRLYPEALYLVANSWGKWNYGGQPDWGPIPEGSFLITESHLRCILTLPRVDKFKDCNAGYKRPCRELTLEEVQQEFNTPPTSLVGAIDVANDGFYLVGTDRNSNTRWVRVGCDGKPITFRSEKKCNKSMLEELQSSENCGDNCQQMTACDYTGCSNNQSPWGVAFAISFDEDVPYAHRDMRYQQFFLTKPYTG